MNDLKRWNGPFPGIALTAASAAVLALLHDDAGQDLIEYALAAALIALGALAAMRGLGTRIGSAFNSLSSSVTSNT